MLLAIDIGNTNIIFGIFNDESLLTTYRTSTRIDQMPDEYALFLITMLQHSGISIENITGIAICSTAPPLTSILVEMCERYFKITPLVVAAGVKTGVRIRMDNPREVGPDRIADAAAAHFLYKGPSIVCDLGTATTFDVISKEGDFIGGAIATGIGTAAEALFRRAAALPRIELVPPKQAIGTNTIAAMQSGIVFGYVGMVEGMVARMQRELSEKATIIATGGYADIIARETIIIDDVNPNITLVGLRLIYMMNKQ